MAKNYKETTTQAAVLRTSTKTLSISAMDRMLSKRLVTILQ